VQVPWSGKYVSIQERDEACPDSSHVRCVRVCVYGIYVSDPAAIIPCMHATLGLYVAYSYCSLGCDVVLSGGGWADGACKVTGGTRK